MKPGTTAQVQRTISYYPGASQRRHISTVLAKNVEFFIQIIWIERAGLWTLEQRKHHIMPINEEEEAQKRKKKQII